MLWVQCSRYPLALDEGRHRLDHLTGGESVGLGEDRIRRQLLQQSERLTKVLGGVSGPGLASGYRAQHHSGQRKPAVQEQGGLQSLLGLIGPAELLQDARLEVVEARG